jgi:hypothetical protein
VIVD